MAGRPKIKRCVNSHPAATFFKPQGVPLSGMRGIVLPVEGLEALRLVDGEGLSQEEASIMMGVSKPTLCRILAQARRVVAKALSNGWAIRIDGGEYEVKNGDQAESSPQDSGGFGCGRRKRCCGAQEPGQVTKTQEDI